jgi:anaphase-promoting complex subunit 8
VHALRHSRVLLYIDKAGQYMAIAKNLPAHVVTRIFAIRFMIELHSPGDAELRGVEELLRFFPGSLFLLTQKALVYYHQRG